MITPLLKSRGVSVRRAVLAVFVSLFLGASGVCADPTSVFPEPLVVEPAAVPGAFPLVERTQAASL